MRVCIIGGSGHANFVFQGVDQDPSIQVVGVAPGSEGEDVGKFLQAAQKRGSSRSTTTITAGCLMN